jgi:hypothetical protein
MNIKLALAFLEYMRNSRSVHFTKIIVYFKVKVLEKLFFSDKLNFAIFEKCWFLFPGLFNAKNSKMI